jgi:hypothetical protein
MPRSSPALVKLVSRATASNTLSAFSGSWRDSFMHKASLCRQTDIPLENNRNREDITASIIN